MTVKQDTLNRHANIEAVQSYAKRLRGWGQEEQIAGLFGGDDTRTTIGDSLIRAADLMEQAAELASRATRDQAQA